MGVGGGLGLAYLQAPKPLPVQSATIVEPVKETPKVERKRFSTDDLYRRTNEERVKAGVPELALSPMLNTSATAKCNDLNALNYWAHNRPDGTEPWHFWHEAGYMYRSAGENLATGDSYSDTVTRWMNSPTHRDNIISPKYTEVGFGICDGAANTVNAYKQLTVQHFGTR